MKILYAIQCTGNGHLSRAREVIPCLMKHGDVDLLLSGRQSDVYLMYAVRYRKEGLSFTFGKKGGIDLLDTLFRLRPVQFIKDIRNCPVEKYDLIINDFEPISAWACKRKSIPCIALSHQSSFLSTKTPRPESRNAFGEMILKTYAPATSWTGFHFQSYDTNIHTPVIRSAVRNALVLEEDHVTVYLPAYDDRLIVKYLSPIKSVRWEIFSKRADHIFSEGNITVCGANDGAFIHSMATSRGVLTGGGFETPSEALFLGKKLFSMPMMNQYEQVCNSAALSQMGIPVMHKMDTRFTQAITDWLKSEDGPHIFFPDETEQIVDSIVRVAGVKAA